MGLALGSVLPLPQLVLGASHAPTRVLGAGAERRHRVPFPTPPAGIQPGAVSSRGL